MVECGLDDYNEQNGSQRINRRGKKKKPEPASAHCNASLLNTSLKFISTSLLNTSLLPLNTSVGTEGYPARQAISRRSILLTGSISFSVQCACTMDGR